MRETTDRNQGSENPDISMAQTGVQAHGLVLGAGADWSIVAVSGTSDAWLGHPPDALLGKSFGEFLPEAAVHRLRSQSQVLTELDPVARLQGCDLGMPGGVADVTMTKSGGDAFFEFEAAEAIPGLATELEQVQRLIRRISQKVKLSDVAIEAARTVRAIAGFDRVSLHRLGPNGLTTALATAGQSPLSADPSAGLLKAHTNAPLSHLHLLADVSAELVPLYLLREAGRVGLDPHPHHLSSLGPTPELQDALRQAGALAAMTLPIRVRDELWGVFLCHNARAHELTVGKRSALELFARLFGSELERAWDRAGQLARSRAVMLRDRLMGAPAPDLAADWLLGTYSAEMTAILPHDGAVLLTTKGVFARGNVPHGAFLDTFAAYIARRELKDVLLIDRMTDVGLTSESFDVAGTAVAALPLSQNKQHVLLLFRNVGSDPNRTKSWSSWETLAANALRASLLDALLNWSEVSHGSAQEIQEDQQRLIAELDHRVRNVLSTILGMVKLTGAKADDSTFDVQALQARIQMLTTAHDRLAQQAWGWINLGAHLTHEMRLAQPAAAQRAVLECGDIEVSPSAFVTVSMVFHELLRNAQEHGALQGAEGQITVSLTYADEGHVEIVWTETGIDASNPRPRRLGLTLIQDAIPYELQGAASVDFSDDRLVARFRLPAEHVRLQSEPSTGAESGPGIGGAALDAVRIDGAALILEDNLMVSLDAAMLLREAGATDVYTCNSVESALNALDQGEISFALLDVDLGSERSLAVAEQVWNDGIPAALATGYGSNPKILADFPPLPVIRKPYSFADLRKTLQHYFLKSSH